MIHIGAEVNFSSAVKFISSIIRFEVSFFKTSNELFAVKKL